MDRSNAALTSRVTVARRRKWLSLLLDTDNEKVAAAYQKYDQLHKTNVEAANKGNAATMPKSGAIGPVKPITTEELSAMSNTEIAAYLEGYTEKDIGMPVLEGRGLANTLTECVAANPQRFTDNLLPFQDVRNLYQYSLLQGCLDAWRNKKNFNWAALLKFIHQILLSKQFWTEQYNDGFNYRNWVFSTTADLITEGTKEDTHAFDTQLLPLAEEVLLILVDKAQQSVSTLNNLLNDVLNSDRGRVFSAMVDYALRFARTNASEYTDCRWSYAIRADFTKRLDRSVEPSLEFSYTIGFHLPYLMYLDKEWVHLNINRIFPQHDEDHWQVAFSGYLLHPGVREEFHSLLKAHGHYQKALSTHFDDTAVLDGLVRHICTGWIEDSETLDDKTSLIYQLIHNGNPNLLAGMVYFFSRRADNLSDKVKVKVMPAWRALFEVLSQHSEKVEYQRVLSPLSQWIGLIDEIDDEVLAWIKVSINYLDKVPGYAFTLSKVIEALQKHILITPEKVGEIYSAIPESELWSIEQTQKNEVEETVRILYEKGCNATAEAICERFAKAGALFLRSVREEYKKP
ncbi:hypothetical protein C6499_22325 [Candidatus Poribacteria bacterium]|nr:MAG: hypothetical protein C6499_22325 [Candidatus Poribacteria bacterium]